MLICVKKNIFLTSRIFNDIFQVHQTSQHEFIQLIYRYLKHLNIDISSFILIKIRVVNWGNI